MSFATIYNDWNIISYMAKNVFVPLSQVTHLLNKLTVYLVILSCMLNNRRVNCCSVKQGDFQDAKKYLSVIHLVKKWKLCPTFMIGFIRANHQMGVVVARGWNWVYIKSHLLGVSFSFYANDNVVMSLMWMCSL